MSREQAARIQQLADELCDALDASHVRPERRAAARDIRGIVKSILHPAQSADDVALLSVRERMFA